MTTNRKGRAGCYQATPKTSKSTFKFTGFGPYVKGCIVTLALWGWLPVGWNVIHLAVATAPVRTHGHRLMPDRINSGGQSHG